MKILNAYTIHSNEACHGGMDLTDHYIIAEDGDLCVTKVEDLYHVTLRTPKMTKTYRFPEHNMNAKLWRLLWGLWRDELQK